VPIGGLTPDEHEMLRQADDDGRLINTLMADGQRLDEGFVRERACQLMGERGWLKFQGWVRGPGKRSAWTSCWTLTDAARRALAAREVRQIEPAPSLRDPSG
jgi:hypothetical protein